MISVIIPTYNRAGTILRSVESVLNQTEKDLELIVVDDCSTDNTIEILKQIDDKRLSVIKLEKNSGACHARNVGIENAKGDFIAFQDSDDEWKPNKLERQLAVCLRKNAGVVFCGLERFDDPNGKNKPFPDLKKSGFYGFGALVERSRVSTQTIFAKREIFNDYLFDVNVRRGQDYDWTIRASQKYRFYYLNDPLVKQFLTPNSISFNGKKVSLEMADYFLEKYKDEFGSNKNLHCALLNRLARAQKMNGISPQKTYRNMVHIKPTVKNIIKYFVSIACLEKSER